MGYPCETALSVRHADGNLTLQMAVIGVKETRLTEENATLTVIELKDKVYPFFVNICYKAWQDADVIETWTEIRHEEKKPVQLQQFASAYLPVRRGNVWLAHLSGAWANEGQLCQEALQPGMKVIKNTDGSTQLPIGARRSDVLARRQTAGEHGTRHRCGTLLQRQLQTAH